MFDVSLVHHHTRMTSHIRLSVFFDCLFVDYHILSKHNDATIMTSNIQKSGLLSIVVRFVVVFPFPFMTWTHARSPRALCLPCFALLGVASTSTSEPKIGNDEGDGP
jgi:hypothetical protein